MQSRLPQLSSIAQNLFLKGGFLEALDMSRLHRVVHLPALKLWSPLGSSVESPPVLQSRSWGCNSCHCTSAPTASEESLPFQASGSRLSRSSMKWGSAMPLWTPLKCHSQSETGSAAWELAGFPSYSRLFSTASRPVLLPMSESEEPSIVAQLTEFPKHKKHQFTVESKKWKVSSLCQHFSASMQ